MSNNDAELVKAGAEGLAEGAMRPFGDLVKALFGPAFAEAGLMLKDCVQHYRFRRQLRLFQRTQEVLANADIEPGSVPLRILIPIIENASNEEDDTLQDIWANLLANAANPERSGNVRPTFPAILKELTAQDVQFLDALFRNTLHLATSQFTTGDVERALINPGILKSIYRKAVLGERETDGAEVIRSMNLSMDTFERNNIVLKKYSIVHVGLDNAGEMGMAYSFTHLGACFVHACRGPQRDQ